MYHVQFKEKFRVKYSNTIPNDALWLQSSPELFFSGPTVKKHMYVWLILLSAYYVTFTISI